MTLTKTVKWLNIMVLLQGVVLVGVVFCLVNSRKQIAVKAIRTERITVSQLSLQRSDGTEVGTFCNGPAGPFLELTSGIREANSITIGLNDAGPSIDMRHGDGRVRISGLSTGPRLEIEDHRIYPSRLLLGTGLRQLVGNSDTNCWLVEIPGLSSGTYPAHEKKLREQLAALTPEATLHDQRQVLTQLHKLGLFEKELPSLFALCERFPEEHQFPWPFVSMVQDIPGYQRELIASLDRQPSYAGLLLLKGIINSKRYEIDGIDLRALLGEIAKRQDLPQNLREDTERMHQHTMRFHQRGLENTAVDSTTLPPTSASTATNQPALRED